MTNQEAEKRMGPGGLSVIARLLIAAGTTDQITFWIDQWDGPQPYVLGYRSRQRDMAEPPRFGPRGQPAVAGQDPSVD